jgi:HAD superfamily hydrolase (TIGR01509 family)
VLRALLFDFNGVLVDDEPLHFRLFRQVLAEEGIDVGEDELDRFLGRDDRSAFAQALTDAGRPDAAAPVARLVARKAAYYRVEIRRSGYPFVPGAAELVRAAARSGVPVGVVTGALRDEVEGALRQEGLDRSLRVLVTAEDVARGKPDPEGYRLALARLNSEPPLPDRLIHPHEVLAVEDSPAGLEAATAAGLRTLALSPSRSGAAAGGAERVVARLEGLSVAGLWELFA